MVANIEGCWEACSHVSEITFTDHEKHAVGYMLYENRVKMCSVVCKGEKKKNHTFVSSDYALQGGGLYYNQIVKNWFNNPLVLAERWSPRRQAGKSNIVTFYW